MRKIGIIMLALLVVVSIVGCSSGKSEGKSGSSAPNVSTVSHESGTAEKGTRSNPIPVGETATVKKGRVTLDMTIEEVLRGDDVWTVAKQVGANDTPSDGCEIAVVKVKVKVLEGADDEPFTIATADFDVFSSDGVGLSGIYAYIPDDATLTGELLTGAEKEGYGSRQVKIGDAAPIARYGDVWFALS